MTINEICNHGFWIISCTSAIKSVISKCVKCRKLCGKTCPQRQKMGNLPADRLSEEPPFTYCGVDMFGPFLIKDGQKRYGAMFTCSSSRAVHIKATSNLTTNSFMQALRQLISRRRNVDDLM